MDQINHLKNKISSFFSWLLLSLIILSSAFLMFLSASQEAAIMDELAHIPAAYSYLRFFDYRLNPEHPPLVKVLAAIPLVFKKLNFPLNQEIWTKEVNGQWAVGNQFIYWLNENKADEIIFLARIFPIFLTITLVVFVYWWSRKLFGKWWAQIPAFLVAFSPHFLAHGHYVTTDVGATLGFFIGLYFFNKQLNSPTPKNTILAGIFFGIAQLMKFSVILLVPLFLFLTIIHWIISCKEKNILLKSKNSFSFLISYLKSLVIIFLIGLAVVWLVYFIFTLNYPASKQQADTEFILSSFAGGPDKEWKSCQLKSLSLRCLANLDIWMAKIPVLRALGHYLLGILMVMQRSAGGNTAYFLGEISGGGWWYYFPIVFLLKESLPALIITLLGIILGLGRIFIKKIRHLNSLREYLMMNFAEFSMLVMVIFYWLYSINSPLNIGFRHILPTIPFIYILATGSLKKWVDKKNEAKINLRQEIQKITSKHLKIGIILFLLVWVLIETVAATPYFISYFNQIGGGVKNGYRFVTDSNYDWGQDLLRLKNFVEKNGIEKIAVDYFGGGDIFYYLKDRAVSWQSAKGNPADFGIKWLAISINSLQGATARPTKGFQRKPEDEYSWLSRYSQPFARVGTSIFVYYLE